MSRGPASAWPADGRAQHPAGPARRAAAAGLAIPLAAGLAVALALAALPRALVRWLPPASWSDPLLARPTLAAAGAVLVLLALAAWRTTRPPRPLLDGVLALLVIALQCMSLRAGPLNLLNVGIVLLASCWLLQAALQPDAPRVVPPLSHLLVLLAALAVWSVAWRPEPGVSLRALLMLLPKLAMAWLLLQLVQSPQRIDAVMRLLCAGAVAAALLGIAQSGLYVLWQQELHLMEEFAPRYITVAGWPLLRASGLMPNPQAYAYPLLVAALWLWMRLLSPGAGAARRWRDGLALLIIVVAYALSFARGAWLALGAAALLAPALARPRRAAAWFGLLAGVALALLASGAARWALASFGDFTASSADVRVELLDAGLRVLAEHPWRGIGIQRFEALSPTLERYPVHNASLQLAVEMGLPALAVYAAFVLRPLLGAVPAIVPARYAAAEQAAARQRLLALALAQGAMLVAIQGDPMAYSEFVLFVTALLEAARRAWQASRTEAAHGA